MEDLPISRQVFFLLSDLRKVTPDPHEHRPFVRSLPHHRNSSLGHRAGVADRFFTEAANLVSVQRVAFDPDEQFFQQPRQVLPLMTREQSKRLLKDRPTLGE